MPAGQPSIYGPTRLWGPVTMGALACVYGPGTGNAGTRLEAITVTNIGASPTGLSFFLGASGYTGGATNAGIAFNFSVPTDGSPYNLIQPGVWTMKQTDVIQCLASLVSVITYGFGIEMQ